MGLLGFRFYRDLSIIALPDVSKRDMYLITETIVPRNLRSKLLCGRGWDWSTDGSKESL